jgi:hypothetical protein
MIALLLTLATFAPSLPVIEVCEINTTPNFTQVILRRWHRLGSVNGHRVSEWWIPRKESTTVERIGDRWLVRSDGREFIARSVRWTETVGDPEMAERKILCPSDRVPYLLDDKK